MTSKAIKYKIVGNEHETYYLKSEGISGILSLNINEFLDRVDILELMYSVESCYIGFLAASVLIEKTINRFEFCSYINKKNGNKYIVVGGSRKSKLRILEVTTGILIDKCPLWLMKNSEIISNMCPVQSFYIGVLGAIKLKNKRIAVGYNEHTNKIKQFIRKKNS